MGHNTLYADHYKCDESRPRCRKCDGYRVSCDFGSSSATLELVAQGSFHVQLEPTVSISHGAKYSSTLPQNDVGYGPTGLPNLERSVPLGPNLSTAHSDPGAIYGPTTIFPLARVSMNSTIAGMIDHSLQSGQSDRKYARLLNTAWRFSVAHLEIMEGFHSRTSLTIRSEYESM